VSPGVWRGGSSVLQKSPGGNSSPWKQETNPPGGKLVLVPADVRAAAPGAWVGTWIRLTAERLMSYAAEGTMI
jgi:hypothetical protein